MRQTARKIPALVGKTRDHRSIGLLADVLMTSNRPVVEQENVGQEADAPNKKARQIDELSKRA
jgi:hypothetical protein